MSDGPAPEHFFRQTAPGEKSPMRAFLETLKPNEPKKLPDSVSRSSTNDGKRGAVNKMSRVMNIVVRTTVWEGEVWVMRLPDVETTKPPSRR